MKILCFFGLHKWIIKREKHQIEGHPDGRSSIRIIVRHCDWCNKRERRYKSDNRSHWSEVIFKEDQTLKFNKYE